MVDTELGRVGLTTCYDLRFPELYRLLSDERAELVIVPAAWPASRIDHWSVLARARAIENQAASHCCQHSGDARRQADGGAERHRGCARCCRG